MEKTSSIATQTSEADPALTKNGNFLALMQAINSCQAALPPNSLQLEMGLMRRDYEKICQQVDEAVHHVGDTEDMVRDHTATLHTVQVRLKHLKARTEDTENRNQRNNLRIIGLPEESKGPDLLASTERFLHTLFPQAPFSCHFVVERAHRMPPTHGPLGAPPHTFIFKLLNFRDRNLILREALKMDSISHEAARLMFFLDFLVDTQKQLKSLDVVKQTLRSQNIKYSMMFPAPPQVADGKTF